jgi:hypothetical protein
METFLALGAVFGFVGVALGAFGSHALRTKLPPERVATFETGVRYQMWHALAIFTIFLVDAWQPMRDAPAFYVLSERGGAPLLVAAGGRSRPGSSCSRAACTRSRSRAAEPGEPSPRAGERACSSVGRCCCWRSS